MGSEQNRGMNVTEMHDVFVSSAPLRAVYLFGRKLSVTFLTSEVPPSVGNRGRDRGGSPPVKLPLTLPSAPLLSR